MLLFPLRSLPAFAISFLLLLSGLTISPIAEAAPLERLSEPQIQQQLTQLPDWTRQDGQLQRTFEWKDFVEAIAFVNKLVEPSEKLAHHPDILILYNRVTITLSTHDAGGLTQKDFDLARTISQIAQSKDK
jgi:4a-hydroxytetrahydrobiopterin dehydratase